MVNCESVNLIGSITVFYRLSISSPESLRLGQRLTEWKGLWARDSLALRRQLHS